MGKNKEKGKAEKLTEKEAKLMALETAVGNIEKNFGRGAVMRMGDAGQDLDVERVSTGCLGLDIALGGGLPKGRIIEVYGSEAGGKTTLALTIIAEIQKAGGIAAFVDAEHALDPQYAQAVGVDVDNLYISQPDNGEQALDITEALLRSGALDIIVIDSVAALVPQAEIEGEMGDQQVGMQARLLSKGLRKLTGTAAKSKCIILFINQIREKIGVTWGNPESQPGGRALKFYSSVRIDIRRIETIKSGGAACGNHVRAKIVKNKVAPPFKQAEFDIMFGKGINKAGDLLGTAVERGIVEKAGSWYTYNGCQIGQGAEKASAWIEANTDAAQEIRAAILGTDNGEKEEAPDA